MEPLIKSMNLKWKTFLESLSAMVDEQGIVQLAQAAPFPDCSLHDLSHLGLLRISGEDAADFLQGQLTNDIKSLTGNRSQMSGYCTPQGRMLANFRVFFRDGAFFLQLPGELLAPIQKRLTLFILMSKVIIEDVSDQLVRIGLAGSCAHQILAEVFPEIPAAAGDVSHADTITLLRLPGTPDRFEVIGPCEAMVDLWNSVKETASPATADHWALQDIRAGIPTVYSATSESFVPQMANMQLVDGVSFTKGCYVGQEVVARMKYLGKLKRRMRLARVPGDRRPLAGEEVFAEEAGGSGQGTCTVVDARPSPEGGYELLVVVTDEAFERGDLHIDSPTGPRLEFHPLPYPLDEGE